MTPRTAAGRALLADFTFVITEDQVRDAILAIEAQAAAPDALRAALADFREWHAQLETFPASAVRDEGYRFIGEADLRILTDFVAALAAAYADE